MVDQDLGAEQVSAPQEHPGESHSGTFTPTAIDAAIRRLFPTGKRRDILALFDNRVSWAVVRHWRKGRAKPPSWAVERVRSAAEAKANEFLAPALAIQESAGIGIALVRWRAQKEKGRGSVRP